MGALVGALRAMLSLDSTAFVAGSNKALRSAKKLEGGLSPLGGAIRKIGLGMLAASTGIALAVRRQLNFADELGEMAERIGVPVKELSRLAYAAQITGVPLETLEKSLGQLSKKMVAATKEGSPAGKMFRDLGVDVVDANGKMRDTEAVLQDLADRFVAMPDGAAKTALAMEMFGKSGAQMMLMLNNGGDGLRVLTEEAKKLGVEIDQQTAAAAGKFNENLDKLGTLGKGLGIKLMAGLAPYMEQLTNYLVDLTTNQFPKFVDDLGIIFSYYGDKFGQWVADVQASIDEFKAGISGAWDSVKASIGGAIDYISAKWDAFVAKLQAAIATAQNVGKAIADALSAGQAGMNDGTGYGGMVGAGDEFGTGMFGAGQQGANGLIDGFTDGVVQREPEVSGVAESITDRVRRVWDINSPSRVFREIGQFLSEGLAEGIKDNVPMAAAAMDEVGDAIEGKADSLQSKLDSFKSSAQNAFVGLVTGAQSFKQAIGQLASQLAQMAAQAAFQQLFGGAFQQGGFLSDLFGGLFANGAAFSQGRVQAFASGGIVNGATAFGMQGGLGVMGEAGPEAIMPLRRGADGKLGVAGQTSRVEVVVQLAVPENVTVQEATTIAGNVAVQVRRAGMRRSQQQLPGQLNALEARGATR